MSSVEATLDQASALASDLGRKKKSPELGPCGIFDPLYCQCVSCVSPNVDAEVPTPSLVFTERQVTIHVLRTLLRMPLQLPPHSCPLPVPLSTSPSLHSDLSNIGVANRRAASTSGYLVARPFSAVAENRYHLLHTGHIRPVELKSSSSFISCTKGCSYLPTVQRYSGNAQSMYASQDFKRTDTHMQEGHSLKGRP